LVVVGNAALVLALWFLTPTKWLDVFFSLHGELALPMVLASWMYSDVPATNLLAPDRERSLAALGTSAQLHRLISVKNTALWLLVSPICMVAALGIGLSNVADGTSPSGGGSAGGGSAGGYSLTLTAITVVWIAIAPLGTLGVSAWVGMIWPYHPISLRDRSANRKPLTHMVLRWVTLLLIPYAIVPALSVLIVAPSALYWHLSATSGLQDRLTDREFGLGTLITCAVSLVVWQLGRRVSLRICARRSDKLVAYLSDPLNG